MTNRLAAATSPYLLQHKDNPVDWWPWSDEAFAEARRRDVPVFLSIGYAACHWCHVMAHESFEDQETAAYLNEHFVSIKVDREERPDVDAVYMEATTAMTGQGGWPMTCFLTPEGEPFFCGTYFPKAQRGGMPAFRQVLAAISEAWANQRAELRESASNVVQQLSQATLPTSAGEQQMTPETLDQAAASLRRVFDAQHGGFGGAPKFPPSMCLEFLLRHAARTGEFSSLEMVERTCEAMARGGIYDQLGGGFARYSVDGSWVVPHFEKMLYDNALLLRVYAHLWRQTRDDRIRELAHRVVTGTGDFLLRELRTPDGGFASSLDADSEGEEGRFYVWTPDQLRDALGATDGAFAAELFSLTPTGTFEHGSSVLQRLVEPEDVARAEAVRLALFAARGGRVRPGRDDKAVAAWNGLAVAALADAGMLVDRPDFVDAAVAAAELLARTHLVDGARLLRVSREAVAGRHAGVLEDYGDVAEGFLALFSATGDTRWLDLAGRLLDTVLDRFSDGAGGFFDTADDAEALVRRPQDPTDNATPSGWAAAAGALLSFGALQGSDRHRVAAETAVGRLAAVVRAHARFAGWSAAVGEAILAGPAEIAVLGPPDDARTQALAAAARHSPSPGAVLAVAAAGEPGASGVHLLAGKGMIRGEPTAFVCRGMTCGPPAWDSDRLTALLQPG